MPRKRRLTGVLALVAGGGLAAGIPAAVAVSTSSPPSSPVILQTTAQIINRGAAAQPTVLVACKPGSSSFLDVSLTERSGNRIVSGFADEQLSCNGQIETITLTVPAQSAPFKPGTASGQASLTQCTNVSCTTATDTENVKLHK
jgi:hypothetical protein